MADGTLTYLAKSPNTGRMRAAAEYLIAATCILATGGELNVSTSLVDDEGVDLVRRPALVGGRGTDGPS